MMKFSAAELEEMNAKHWQAGVTCLQYEEFKKTEYGRSKLDQPPWTLEIKNLDATLYCFHSTKDVGEIKRIEGVPLYQ